ncbi:hypothetical protein HNP46_006753 [Pseudomonas nitritireducens]|uniref:Uncharacterized protein n=1 Tax=Pseudomonas nitroreducens TaxID=46680 RepID=A0A7W7KSK8_PSENT|nr:hypothetical protein [Pseudomonas nitritireducens]MBB4867834.1 hypothetical protein [Pseudomonas nitritireducens]
MSVRAGSSGNAESAFVRHLGTLRDPSAMWRMSCGYSEDALEELAAQRRALGMDDQSDEQAAQILDAYRETRLLPAPWNGSRLAKLVSYSMLAPRGVKRAVVYLGLFVALVGGATAAGIYSLRDAPAERFWGLPTAADWAALAPSKQQIRALMPQAEKPNVSQSELDEKFVEFSGKVAGFTAGFTNKGVQNNPIVNSVLAQAASVAEHRLVAQYPEQLQRLHTLGTYFACDCDVQVMMQNGSLARESGIGADGRMHYFVKIVAVQDGRIVASPILAAKDPARVEFGAYQLYEVSEAMYNDLSYPYLFQELIKAGGSIGRKPAGSLEIVMRPQAPQTEQAPQ